MTIKFDLAGLPLEVFSLVLDHLFNDVTVRAQWPSMLSRIDLVARKQPELAILQLLGGDYHQLAKTSLLKVAWFKFDRFNPTVSFSSSYKYLDCIQRLSVNFRDLYVWTTLKVNQPAKHFIPFETAQIWARRKSLRILKITNHFICTHDRFMARSVRERIGNALDAGIRSNRGEGVRDIIKLGRERVSDSCDLILELSFSLYGDEPFDCKASISKGMIIDFTSSSDSGGVEVVAELNDWYKPTSLK